MTDDLVKRLLWHVEQVLGPVSDEPIVNEHDSDKAILLFNFQAETKRAIEYWYRQGKDDQHQMDADHIEALTAENERLREALKKIAYGNTSGFPGINEGINETFARELMACREVARAALGDTQ